MRYEIPSIGTTFDRSEAVPQEGPVNLRILCESSHGILVEVMGATKTVLPWQYYDIVANKEPVKITPIDGYDSAIRTYKVTRIIYPSSIDYLTDESDILCSTVGLEDIENLDEKIDLTKSDLETEISTVNTSLSNKIDGVKSELQGNINTVENNLQQVNTSLSSEINQTKSDLEAEINTVNTSLSSEIDSVESGLATANSNIATNKSAIDILQIDKANRGYLQFNKAKLSTSTNNAKNLPLTLCLTYDCDDWSPCVGKGFGSGLVLFNTEIVDWSKDMHYGFNFGVYSGTGNANEIHLVVRIANNLKGKVANNYIGFNMATGKHTLCVSISEIADFAVRFYQDGAFLGIRTNTGSSTSMLDNIGGATGIHIATMANYATVGGQTLIPNLKLSRLKIFNCVLPATKADDTNGIGYTIEDYNNGVDESPNLKGGKTVFYNVDVANMHTVAYKMGDVATALSYDTDGYLCLAAANSGTLENTFPSAGARYDLGYTLPAGTKIRIKYDDWQVPSSAWLISGNYGRMAVALSDGKVAADTGNTKDFEYTLSGASTSILIKQEAQRVANTSVLTISEGTIIWKIKNLRIWINGALLSLQNYTVLNGSTQQVFDVSGNANDATATLSDGGSLKGSNDISVSRLIDFVKGQSA